MIADRRWRLVAVLSGFVMSLGSLVCSSSALATTVYRYAPPSFGSLSHPTGVAVDKTNGNVFVANGGGPELVNIFGAAGGPPAGGAPSELTGVGTPAGSFVFGGEPVGVAVDNSGGLSASALYVADVAGGGQHEVIDKFLLNGSGEYEYVSQLTGFGEPLGVSVDGEGNVYVSDYAHGSVHEFDSSGKELAEFKSSLIGTPQGVAVDAAGNIFEASYGSGALIELKRGSTTSAVVTSEVELLGGGVSGVAYDLSTNHLFVDLGSHIAEYDDQWNLVEEFGSGAISASAGITVNEANGDLYTTEGASGQIVVFQPTNVLPPAIVSESVTNVRRLEATLSASINPGSASTSYFFEYVPADRYAAASAEPYAAGFRSHTSAVGAGNLAVATAPSPLAELRAGTTYYYRVVAVNAEGTSTGPDQTFTTSPATPPSVVSTTVENITATTATLVSTIDPRDLPSSIEIDLGVDTGYGTRSFPHLGALGAPLVVTLSALSPGTTYHYRVVATNEDGTVQSADQTFTTPGFVNPLIVPPAPILVATPAFPVIKTPASTGTKHKKKKKKKASKHKK